jgi:hypothetical protein
MSWCITSRRLQLNCEASETVATIGYCGRQNPGLGISDFSKDRWRNVRRRWTEHCNEVFVEKWGDSADLSLLNLEDMDSFRGVSVD